MRYSFPLAKLLVEYTPNPLYHQVDVEEGFIPAPRRNSEDL
jgi:hypothetical protein